MSPPHSPEIERQARSRIRLMTPENAGKVLSRDIYWTVPFLELFLEDCDRRALEDPRAAHALARHAPGLARRIGVGARPGEYLGAAQKASYEVRALAVLAGLHRRLGQPTRAGALYEEAWGLAESGDLETLARAELNRRYAIFLAENPRAADPSPPPREFLERAADLYRAIEHRDGLGECYLLRGNWRFAASPPPSGAGVDFALAMRWADPETLRGKRTLTAALTNFAYVVGMDESATLIEHARALELLQTVKKRLGRQRRSFVKVTVLAMEGLLHRKLHFHRQAARLLGRAREGFAALGLPAEFAKCSLDLAIVYLEDEESEAFEALRLETHRRLRDMEAEPSLLELLGGWTGAVGSPRRVQSLRAGLVGLEAASEAQASAARG
ncbi:MAG: hypothetical protein AAF725_19300 [Acidobacteriota bacterium]